MKRLTLEDARDIRKAFDLGTPRREIAEAWGIHLSTVSDILLGKRHKEEGVKYLSSKQGNYTTPTQDKLNTIMADKTMVTSEIAQALGISQHYAMNLLCRLVQVGFMERKGYRRMGSHSIQTIWGLVDNK